MKCAHKVKKTVVRQVKLTNYAGQSEVVQVSKKVCVNCGYQS